MTSTILVKADFSGDWVEGLQAAYPDLQVCQWDAPGNLDEIDYTLVWQPTPGFLATLPNLKVIYSIGAGIDHLAADPDLPKHLPIVRMVDPSLTAGMASYVSWAAMHLHRRVFAINRQQRAKDWLEDPLIIRESKPSTVGVLGLGNLGQACAKQLIANKFKVIGWSQSAKNIDDVESFTGADGFDEMLSKTDICVSLLPLTSETKGILNKQNLSKIRNGGSLINVGRGPQLVEQDLIDLLDTGHLSGAVLDVFSQEPLPQENPLWARDDVLITPHVASVTDALSAGATVAGSILKYEQSGELANLVNWERGY